MYYIKIKKDLTAILKQIVKFVENCIYYIIIIFFNMHYKSQKDR